MKTFNTEENNIPEGATHYSDESESDCFAWFKSELGINYLWCPGIEGEEYWIALINQNEMYGEEVKPIPQTEEAVWVNGDEIICTAIKKELNPCTYVGRDGNLHVFKMSNGHYESVTIEYLAKPETEAERIERERLENGKTFYQLMSDIETSIMNPADSGYPNEWGELRDNWQEVYMRQAEALGFKKEE